MLVAIDPLEKTPAENLYKTPIVSNVLISIYTILTPIRFHNLESAGISKALLDKCQ